MGVFPHLLDQRRLIGPGGSTVAGSMYFFYSETDDLAPIYADPSAEVPFTNPIVLAAGQIIPSFYLDDSITYRRRIEYADGTFDDEDPLGSLFGGGGDLGVPVGTQLDYMGGTIPEGYLLCYGQAISRTTYSALFAAISTTYGPGNGTTTFNLPDSRGRVNAGKDNMGGVPAARLAAPYLTGTTLGAVGGAQSHVLTVAQLAAHDHEATVTDPGHDHDYSAYQGGITTGVVDAFATNPVTKTTATAPTGITVDNAPAGADEPHNNVQPTLICNKIIKAFSTSLISLIALFPDTSGKVNASAIGVSATDTSMGVFLPNSIYPDNVSAKDLFQTISNIIAAAFSGGVVWDLPDEANGDAIPALGTGLMYLSAGVVKIA